MNMFESRSNECISAMREALRYLDEKRGLLRQSSSNARQIIVEQIAHTKDKIMAINTEFQAILDDMMKPSPHPSV